MALFHFDIFAYTSSVTHGITERKYVNTKSTFFIAVQGAIGVEGIS